MVFIVEVAEIACLPDQMRLHLDMNVVASTENIGDNGGATSGHAEDKDLSGWRL
ncbi:MAG TPA: hypothetical protein VGL54_03885 [Solirubrobacteraceae bacterium]